VRALSVNPKAAGMIEYGGTFARAYLLKRALFMPWELTGLLAPDVVAEGLRRLMPVHLLERELRPNPPTAAGRISVLESTQYMRSRLLRDTDWASMAHSLEVRTPLVDATLLQSMVDIFAASGEPPSKAMLARAPTTPLPARVRQRPKTGFMTPIATWQRQSARHRELASSPHEPWARAWAGVVRNGPEASWRPA
jgi:asparagine synthase (glutamine-hydrolysing)